MPKYVRKPKYKLSEYRQNKFGKSYGKLTDSQKTDYENYKSYIKDYKGFQRERLKNANRVEYQKVLQKNEGKTRQQISRNWEKYRNKKENNKDKYYESVDKFYTYFKSEFKELQQSDKYIFSSRNPDRYTKNKKVNTILSEKDGFLQVVINYKNDSGQKRAYSKTFTIDQVNEFGLSEIINDAYAFFEDDQASYNVEKVLKTDLVFITKKG
jgi:uncharacterized protein (DUF885 family)